MKDDTFFMDYAHSAYTEWARVTNSYDYFDQPITKWEDLSDGSRQAWVAAIKNVFLKLNVRDAETGELFVKVKHP